MFVDYQKKYTPEVAKKKTQNQKYTTEVWIDKQPNEILLTQLNRWCNTFPDAISPSNHTIYYNAKIFVACLHTHIPFSVQRI